MAKKYKGSLTLDWFNKQKSVLSISEGGMRTESDTPAPKINWVNKEDALFYEVTEKKGVGATPFWVSRDGPRHFSGVELSLSADIDNDTWHNNENTTMQSSRKRLLSSHMPGAMSGRWQLN